MPTIFTRIIAGEIPGRLVWEDEHCVVMVDIRPLHRGHCLVIPRAEVDHWIDLDSATSEHCFEVARIIGHAQMAAFAPRKVGVMLAGLEVPHTHVHVVPIQDERDLDFAKAAPADQDDLAAAAGELRAKLRAAGAAGVSE